MTARPSKHHLITSSDPAGAGVVLVDGLISIPVRIAARPDIDLDAVARAEMTLSLAAALHHEGAHHQSFAWAVRAARECFEAIGTAGEMLEPLKHLFDALSDLDQGTIDPALAPKKWGNRPIEPSAEWHARACLSAAVDGRMLQGDTLEQAAESIRKATTIIANKPSVERSAAIRRLLDWRKRFRSSSPPPRVVVYETTLKLLNDASRLNDKGARLAAYTAKLLEMARDHRHRLASVSNPPA